MASPRAQYGAGMCPRSRPAHAREEPAQLFSEDVLSSARWRDRVTPDNGAALGRRADQLPVLERSPALTLRGRIARAVRAPVLAGIAVFVVAIVATIGIAVSSSLGAQLFDSAEAGVGIAEGASSEAGFDGGAGAAGSSGAPGAAGADTPATDGASGEGTLFVHVVGAVKRAGVVELPTGARVRDAIEAAGGASDEAVLAGVNLARVVVDGEQLLVPDTAALEAAADVTGGPGGAQPGVGGTDITGAATAGGASTAQGTPQVVNINTADAALLETLPRVGPALAGRIIDWREQNGGFASVDQLLEVTGIGVKTLEGFRDRVTV